MIDSAVNYLLFLAGLGGSVSILIEKMKPLVLETVLERYGEQAYILSIYAVRIIASFIAVALFGGTATLIDLVPFFAKVPEVGVWVVSILLISLGSDWLHVLLDYLYALRDGKRDNGAMISFPAEVVAEKPNHTVITGSLPFAPKFDDDDAIG